MRTRSIVAAGRAAKHSRSATRTHRGSHHLPRGLRWVLRGRALDQPQQLYIAGSLDRRLACAAFIWNNVAYDINSAGTAIGGTKDVEQMVLWRNAPRRTGMVCGRYRPDLWMQAGRTTEPARSTMPARSSERFSAGRIERGARSSGLVRAHRQSNSACFPAAPTVTETT